MLPEIGFQSGGIFLRVEVFRRGMADPVKVRIAVAALMESQAVGAAGGIFVQGVFAGIEMLQGMGQPDRQVKIGKGIDPDLTGRLGATAVLAGGWLAVGAAVLLRLILGMFFADLIDQIHEAVCIILQIGVFTAGKVRIIFVQVHVLCEAGKTGVKLIGGVHFGDDQRDGFLGKGDSLDHQWNIVNVKIKVIGRHLHHIAKELFCFFGAVGQFAELDGAGIQILLRQGAADLTII